MGLCDVETLDSVEKIGSYLNGAPLKTRCKFDEKRMDASSVAQGRAIG